MSLRDTAAKSVSAEELAWRSQKGCQASFAQLVDRYAAGLLSFLRRRTESLEDAEDLVQDTFVRAYENIGRYKNCWKFSTWLFTIAGRLASSHHRSSRSTKALGEVESEAPDPAEATVRREAKQGLWDSAAELPEGQYEALRLKYAEDMSIRQIAQVLGKSQVGVKVLLYRARVNLGRRLGDMAGEDAAAGDASTGRVVSFVKTGGKRCSAGSSD